MDLETEDALKRRSTYTQSEQLYSTRKGSVLHHIVPDNEEIHVDDGFIRNASVSDPAFGALSADSKEATKFETSRTIKQSLHLYRKAMTWSFFMSSVVIMVGYDSVLIIGLFGLDIFNQRYHNQVDSNGSATISASWKSGLTNAIQVGEIMGLCLTGPLLDRFGYKKTISTALVFLTAVIFVTFFAQNLPMLLIGQLLCGLPWGTFQIATTAYASEIAPVNLRGYLTTYVNMCWSIGQLIEAGVLRGMLGRQDQWAYRIPFAIQWLWPVPLLVASLLMPESPWWLVRRGRFDDAKRSLDRLTTKTDAEFDVSKIVAMMEHTIRLERNMSSGSSFLDLFKGVNRYRTEISCMVWITQAFCGANLMGYSTVFYQRAGLSSVASFSMSMGVYAIGLIAGFGAWVLMTHAGRRTLYILGQTTLLCLLLIIGLLGIGGREARFQWATGSLIVIFALVYDSTVGPVCYSLISEMPSTRLKAKTISLARMCTNVGSIVVNILTNYQLTTTAWNWGPYSAFFWAGTNLVCLVWMVFRLPETKHRTYGELDVLFEKNVKAWRFERSKVDIFRGSTIAVSETSCQSDASSLAATTQNNDSVQQHLNGSFRKIDFN